MVGDTDSRIAVCSVVLSTLEAVMQVHLAKLKGERVVVKVQRPGLRQLFDIDLKNIRVLAQWLQAVDPKSDGAARDWVAIYDECSRILYQVHRSPGSQCMLDSLGAAQQKAAKSWDFPGPGLT